MTRLVRPLLASLIFLTVWIACELLFVWVLAGMYYPTQPEPERGYRVSFAQLWGVTYALFGWMCYVTLLIVARSRWRAASRSVTWSIASAVVSFSLAHAATLLPFMDPELLTLYGYGAIIALILWVASAAVLHYGQRRLRRT